MGVWARGCLCRPLRTRAVACAYGGVGLLVGEIESEDEAGKDSSALEDDQLRINGVRSGPATRGAEDVLVGFLPVTVHVDDVRVVLGHLHVCMPVCVNISERLCVCRRECVSACVHV